MTPFDERRGYYSPTYDEDTAPDSGSFWTKVDKSGDCWLWTGSRRANGYGQVSNWQAMKEQYAHRLAWSLTNGPIPSGMQVLHKCDNPPCCNPAHLVLGTQADNMRDMTDKGRNWQSRKTHCKSGHEFTDENTRIDKQGWRHCRTCHEGWVRAYEGRRRIDSYAADTAPTDTEILERLIARNCLGAVRHYDNSGWSYNATIYPDARSALAAFMDATA